MEEMPAPNRDVEALQAPKRVEEMLEADIERIKINHRKLHTCTGGGFVTVMTLDGSTQEAGDTCS